MSVPGKKKIKTFKEFTEQQGGFAARKMANITMGDESDELLKQARSNGVNVDLYFNAARRMINNIEKNMPGQGIQVLQKIILDAAAGKKNLGLRQQMHRIEKNQQQAQPQPQQQPQMPQQQGNPTPLNQIGQ